MWWRRSLPRRRATGRGARLRGHPAWRRGDLVVDLVVVIRYRLSRRRRSSRLLAGVSRESPSATGAREGADVSSALCLQPERVPEEVEACSLEKGLQLDAEAGMRIMDGGSSDGPGLGESPALIS